MPRIGLLVFLPLITALAQPGAPGLRLPGDVRPLSYSVDLRLDPAREDFNGSIRIEVEVLRETRALWLHAKDLSFRSARIGGAEAKATPADGDFASFTPGAPLVPGRTTLEIEYDGKLSGTLTDGIFRERENGDWYIFTKFEPVTARRAFPCFDEPSFKTPWQLTLHVPAGLTAVSNTPAEREEREAGGTKSVRFARTRPLPSYLVALAVGPFDVVDAQPVGRKRVPARIVVPRGRGPEAAAAAGETPKAIELLEEYFGIPYPYEKLDQIVVPITTSWGAMENAGLIAYNQVLLARPETDSLSRRQNRLDAMVHEMSHQWFGDLVTMAWWEDIWLNEGFASWITSSLLNQWHPEWKVASSQAGGANAAMNADALVSSRKVRQPIEAPGDIANAFDRITYVKGASILRMFESWLGAETFRKGVREYLAKHAWGNATTADFVASITKASGRDLGGVFSSFLDQRGVPLLKADIGCGGPRPRLRLAQEPFVPIGSQASGATLWRVPVCVRWSDGKAEHRECFLLDKVSAEFPLEGAGGCPAWFEANDGATGYYRTSYGGDWFNRLLERGAEKLKPQEVVAALQNAQALVGAGKINAAQALGLARTFTASGERDVFTAALRIQGSIMQVVPDDLQARYKSYLREWLGPRARQLGWQPKPGESEDTKAIRLAVVPLLAIGAEDPELGAEARKLAEMWLNDRKSIDREAAGVILIAAARHGDRALFDRMVSELRKTKEQQERYSIVGALGSFSDPAIEGAALDLVLNGGDGLDARELQGVISGQWNETRPIVWEYVQRNFEALNAKLPGARGIAYGATLPRIAAGFCDEDRANEVEAFFKPKIAGLSGGARNLAGALESIRLCTARKRALEPGVRALLGSGQARLRILVAYDSVTGNTEKLARAVGAGAASSADVTVVKSGDFKPEEIAGYDGVVVGTPVHWSNVSAGTKRFLDAVGAALWKAKMNGDGRTAGAFCTGGGVAMGKDIARLSILSAFLTMRYTVIGGVDADGFGTLGPEATTGPADPGISEKELEEARRFGDRFARLTARLREAR